MQKLKQELNAKIVGAGPVSAQEKGITLIALIITIIVMLILVGVTINVALNGGLFSKAEEAGAKTKIAQIQESLTIKKAEVLADYDGKAPADYGITIDKLNLPTELRTEYVNKLIISKEAKLYYDASVVTNTEEQKLFKSMGIQDYVENGNREPEVLEFYGVGYEVLVEGKTMTIYVLKNEIVVMTDSEIDNDIIAIKGINVSGTTVNNNEGNVFARFSDDYSTLSYAGLELARNENKIYKYSPNIFDETYHIYLNAFYIREDEGNVISTFTEGLDLRGGEMADGNYCLFTDMEAKGITVSQDGETITYEGNTYTRLKK